MSGLALCLAAPLARAAPDPSWLVRAWNSGDGLPGDNFVDLVQAPDGFIWGAAGRELVRFDGAAFKVFPLRYANGAEQKVRELAPLRDGGLALALMSGAIARTGPRDFEALSRDLVSTKSRVECLFEHPDGSLIVVCNNEAVFRLRDGRLEPFGQAEGLPSGEHCRFAVDRDGRVWFVKGTAAGLFRDGRFETTCGLPSGTLRAALAPARDGGVWIGAGTGLYRLGREHPLEKVGDLGLPGSEVRPTVLLEDSAGAVWFGTYASGLFRFDDSRFRSVPISFQQVLSLMEDREGGIWVGTSGGGLDQVQPRMVTIEGGKVGLPNETVQAICEDSAGTLWAVTQDGLVTRRRGERWEPPEGFSLANATCIAAGADGAVWIGSKSGGLYRWRGGRLSAWGRPEGLSDLSVRFLVPAKSGDLWIGSSQLGSARPGEVHRLHADRIEPVPLTPRTDLIRAMTGDAAGDVWIAGTSRKLWRASPDGSVSDQSALIPNPPQQIHVMQGAPDGSVWIGYDQGGIGRIKDGRIGLVTSRDGLWDDHIEMLLSDGRGGLWLAANRVLFKVDERELAAVAEGRARRVKSVRYGQDQGLRANFGGSAGAMLRSDGCLWIPLATSLVIVDPSQARPAPEPPPVVISEVRVDGLPVAAHPGFAPADGLPAETAPLRLPPGHRRVDVDFTALSFLNPANVLFRYRLDGLDDRWVEGGALRSVSYARLPPGRYRFRVTACNSDGIWSEEGASHAFAVAPFFWDTWWFRLAAVAAFTGCVFAVARYVSLRRLRSRLRRAERETAVERERSRIARDIHDELGSRLTKIVLLSGLATRARAGGGADEEADDRVWEISRTARQLLGSLDETVWAVNPRNDNLPNLVGYLGEHAVAFLRTAEIRCHLDLPPDPPARPVPADVRHHLLLAVKETLNNIVRHAQADSAWMRIAVSDQALTVTLEDNGRGIPEGPPGAGADGLANMEQRMRQIGGQAEIRSRPGGGTRVSFIVPWSKPF